MIGIRFLFFSLIILVACGETSEKKSESQPSEPKDGDLLPGQAQESTKPIQSMPVEATCKKTERRVRYASNTVDLGELCKSEAQEAICDSKGDLIGWTGNYGFEDCRTFQPKACETVTHGSEQKRVRFFEDQVNFGLVCKSEDQARICTNGQFSNWTGTASFDDCQTSLPLACGATAHGAQTSRIKYQAATVAYDSSCISEAQTGTCDNGVMKWSGTYSVDACEATAPLACGDVVHGAISTRYRYKTASVKFGQTCDGENQAGQCVNGTIPTWSGSFTSPTCFIEAPISCNGIAHKQTLTRTRFFSDRITFSETCNSQTQTSTCNDGVLSGWTGSAQYETCLKDEPRSCGEVAHNQSANRIRYANSVIPFGSSCRQEVQTAQCFDGTLRSWTGTYTSSTCTVSEPLACGEIPHEGYAGRTRFKDASLPFGQTCQNEQQSAKCYNGNLLAWNGTFAHDRCEVARPLACGATPHDGNFSQTYYQAPWVKFGESCVSEVRTATCYNGSLSPLSGTFPYNSCSALPPSNCGDTAHGQSISDTTYAKPIVAASESCVSETKILQCNNGTFVGERPSLKYRNCSVAAAKPSGYCDTPNFGPNGDVRFYELPWYAKDQRSVTLGLSSKGQPMAYRYSFLQGYNTPRVDALLLTCEGKRATSNQFETNSFFSLGGNLHFLPDFSLYSNLDRDFYYTSAVNQENLTIQMSKGPFTPTLFSAMNLSSSDAYLYAYNNSKIRKISNDATLDSSFGDAGELSLASLEKSIRMPPSIGDDGSLIFVVSSSTATDPNLRNQTQIMHVTKTGGLSVGPVNFSDIAGETSTTIPSGIQLIKMTGNNFYTFEKVPSSQNFKVRHYEFALQEGNKLVTTRMWTSVIGNNLSCLNIKHTATLPGKNAVYFQCDSGYIYKIDFDIKSLDPTFGTFNPDTATYTGSFQGYGTNAKFLVLEGERFVLLNDYSTSLLDRNGMPISTP